MMVPVTQGSEPVAQGIEMMVQGSEPVTQGIEHDGACRPGIRA
jgi:hypothetical protein